MGHTAWSQRIVIDRMIAELEEYGKALRPKDRDILNQILKLPLKHLGSISYASSLHAWAFLTISAMIEQEKRIKDLEVKINTLSKMLSEDQKTGGDHGCVAHGRV